MTEQSLPLTPFYGGWSAFQRSLVKIIAPLSPEQLAFPAAPHHWSIGMVTQHIVANRVWWFHRWMGAGDPTLDPIADWGWDEEDKPVGSAAELVAKLETTWQMVEEALAHWAVADLGDIIPVPPSLSEEEQQRFSPCTRQWIIWHVLEHEIFHGGELSLGLGAHGLEGIYGAN